MHFQKKPVVIEAIRVPPPTDTKAWGELAGWLLSHQAAVKVAGDEQKMVIGLDIETLEGTMRANVGDWVIRGVKGEFYPCRNDIFEMTYEPVAVPTLVG